MTKIRLNGDLRGTPLVRVIAADGEMLGVMTLADALRAAMEAGLDLVEVNPEADPPVCKVLDFGKYKYEAVKSKRDPDESDDD
jgi:translation initiation factor IF-3